jgi:hypothetical protein
VLYEKTWKGLSRPDFADSTSVLNLYHEGTHAYIDLVDYDDTREFGEAMKHYEWAKLTRSTYVFPDVETERAAQEAAAMYVGNRAATVWKTWGRLKLMEQIVKNVADGKLTATRGAEIMRNTGKSTVANDYGAEMSERIFGYIERDGKQIEIADRPIYYKLAEYCDKVILENCFFDHIVKMPALGNYIDIIYKAAQKFPELAKAMVTA